MKITYNHCCTNTDRVGNATNVSGWWTVRCNGCGEQVFVRPVRPRGRPQVGPTVEVRLPADLVARLDDDAEAQGVSRAELIRRRLTS